MKVLQKKKQWSKTEVECTIQDIDAFVILRWEVFEQDG